MILLRGKFMKKAPINKCPHCGSEWGFYTRQQATGTIIYQYKFDGSEDDNENMYDLLKTTGGENAYCKNCNKILFKMKEIN